jgi:hypothetical protein
MLATLQERPRDDWKKLIVFSKQWPEHQAGVFARWWLVAAVSWWLLLPHRQEHGVARAVKAAASSRQAQQEVAHWVSCFSCAAVQQRASPFITHTTG